jgi:hypothetical protein
MSRVAGSPTTAVVVSPVRCTSVWAAVTGLVALAGVLAADAVAWASQHLARTSSVAPEAAVVLLASVALLGSSLWAWLVATTTVVEAWRHGRVSPTGGAVRRAVLLACGVAVSVGVAGPVAAADGQAGATTSAVRIDGLPLPDRATATSPPAPRVAAGPTPGSPAVVEVRPGDSLWRIAVRQLPDGADVADVDALWRRLHAHNRDVIGADPDLLLPGQRLALPPADRGTE